ncbi:MAG: hypothetical protein BV458_12375 [Thermoplasmata archaeon M9B2D]|nr:MAG: hypothetical protein BV458_12375 [Thermoplasmata archaeon M9B2D]
MSRPFFEGFLFYEKRQQYPEREKRLKGILDVAEFLDYQSTYFPMDKGITPTMNYRKDDPLHIRFYVPLCGNGKNKLLLKRLIEIVDESSLYIELVPVRYLWERRTIVQIELTRDMLDMMATQKDHYQLSLSSFCRLMRELINYEEYAEVYSTGVEFNSVVTSKTVRIYPPEKGG